MNTLTYRTVVSKDDPTPSGNEGSIPETAYGSKIDTTALGPIQILINNEVLKVPGYYLTNIFSGFHFILSDTILLLKTTDNRFVVLYKVPGSVREYALFSTNGYSVFNEVIDINCGSPGLAKVWAFCVTETDDRWCKLYHKYRRKMFLHRIGWGFTMGRLDGLDTSPVTIEYPENDTQPIVITELFGPLPESGSNGYDYRNAKEQWYVALCGDDKYRILHNSSIGLLWVTTEDKLKIEVFKRFIPLPKLNYFYFLTDGGNELILRACNGYSVFNRILEEARKKIYEDRINPYITGYSNKEKEDVFLFPGMKFQTWNTSKEEVTPAGSFTQQDHIKW